MKTVLTIWLGIIAAFMLIAWGISKALETLVLIR